MVEEGSADVGGERSYWAVHEANVGVREGTGARERVVRELAAEVKVDDVDLLARVLQPDVSVYVAALFHQDSAVGALYARLALALDVDVTAQAPGVLVASVAALTPVAAVLVARKSPPLHVGLT